MPMPELGTITRRSIVIKPGFKFELTVKVIDRNNIPRNLAGFTGDLNIYDHDGELLTALTSFVAVTGNQVLVDLPDNITDAFDWSDAFYVLSVRDTGQDQPYCIMEGPIRTDRGD